MSYWCGDVLLVHGDKVTTMHGDNVLPQIGDNLLHIKIVWLVCCLENINNIVEMILLYY